MQLLFFVSCASINSAVEAEAAYLGLDQAVSRALDLGLKGFAEASSANIDAQSGDGAVSGTLTVTGQVDQGESDNKGLRLMVALSEYADEVDLDLDGHDDVSFVYDTDTPLDLDIQLRDIPDGTLTGTLVGQAVMAGDLVGPATFDLAFDGTIESDGAGGTQRVADATAVTGTVTGPQGGVWEVDVVR